VFGVNLQLSEHVGIYTNYGIENGIEDARSQGLIGVRTNIPINHWLTGNIFLERVETFQGPTDEDFTAYGFALKMTRVEEKGSMRVEVRHGEDGVQILANPALTIKWDDDWTSFWRTRHFQKSELNHFVHSSLFGQSYRPQCNDKWNLIGKLQFDWERDYTIPEDFEEIILATSLDIHYQPFTSWDFMLRYANKYAQTRFGGAKSSSFTELVAGRLLYEFHSSFDAGIHGGILRNHQDDQFNYAYGVEIGAKLVKNLWLSIGYNLKGFQDDDMVGNDFLREGFYISVRFKFDEKTAEDMLPAW